MILSCDALFLFFIFLVMIFSVDFIDKSTKYEVIIFVKNNKIITYKSIKNYQKREKTNLKQKFRVVDFRIQ